MWNVHWNVVVSYTTCFFFCCCCTGETSNIGVWPKLTSCQETLWQTKQNSDPYWGAPTLVLQLGIALRLILWLCNISPKGLRSYHSSVCTIPTHWKWQRCQDLRTQWVGLLTLVNSSSAMTVKQIEDLGLHSDYVIRKKDWKHLKALKCFLHAHICIFFNHTVKVSRMAQDLALPENPRLYGNSSYQTLKACFKPPLGFCRWSCSLSN